MSFIEFLFESPLHYFGMMFFVLVTCISISIPAAQMKPSRHVNNFFNGNEKTGDE